MIFRWNLNVQINRPPERCNRIPGFPVVAKEGCVILRPSMTMKAFVPRWGPFFLTTLLLAGCASLRSTQDPGQMPRDSKPVSSTSYYLPRGMIQVVGAKGADGRFTVTVSEVLDPEIDRKPFYLRYGPGLFNNDYYRVQVNPKGLLESVTFMDANPNWNVVAQGVLPTAALPLDNGANPAPFSRLLDPFDPAALDAFNKDMGDSCHLDLALPAPMETSTQSRKGLTYDGIVFHPMIPVIVSLKAGRYEQRATLPVPDRRVTLAFSTDRGWIDERGAEIEFMDGMLTTVHINHESVVTVILGIPKTLITDTIPLPPGW